MRRNPRTRHPYQKMGPMVDQRVDLKSYKMNRMWWCFAVAMLLSILALVLAFLAPFFPWGRHEELSTSLDGLSADFANFNDVFIDGGPVNRRRTTKETLSGAPLTMPHYRTVYVNASEYYHRGELLSLKHLRDVSFETSVLMDGQVLMYDGSTNEWKPRNITKTYQTINNHTMISSVYPNKTLGELTDVNLEYPLGDKAYLVYNASSQRWVSMNASSMGNVMCQGEAGAGVVPVFDGDSETHMIEPSLVAIDASGNIGVPPGATVDGRDVSQDGLALDNHLGNTNNPHSVTLFDVGIPLVQNTKHNFLGLANPTDTDDASENYSRGSIWITQGTGAMFVCMDATEGGAYWMRTDFHEGVVGSYEIQDGSITSIDLDSTHQKDVANGICGLDAQGKIPAELLPPLSITSVSVVANIPARDALSPQEGDVAVVEDADGLGHPSSYIYSGTEWVMMQASSDVLSVAGRTGNVVLSTSDVAEGVTNKYYTEARVSANSDVVSSVAHSVVTNGNPHGVTKADLGLAYVQNLKNEDAANADPTAFDDASEGFSVGSRWTNVASGAIFQCLQTSFGAAVWKRLDLYSSAVTTSKLADAAVTDSKLADSSVTALKLADASVSTLKLADASVTVSKLADSSVGSSKLADASVTALKLADSSVTASKLADSSVGSSKLADASVTASKLADSSVGSSKLADSSVGSSKLADASVTAQKLDAAYQKNAALGVCGLDAGGLIPTSLLPPLSITTVTVVANITARNALGAQEGDVAVVENADGFGHPSSFMYDGSAWHELQSSSEVFSVAGRTGVVVLDTDDVAESATNKYYTDARVSANSDVVANSAHSALTSGNPHGVTLSDLGIANVENIKNRFVSTMDPANVDDLNAGYSKGSMWVNSATGGTFTCYDASAGAAQWVRLDTADSSIDENKLAADAVRSSHILDGTIVHADTDTSSVQRRVTGTCASDSHVTSISETGTVTCSNAVASNTVGSSQIVDGSVATVDIANAAVTSTKLGTGSVASVHILDGSITATDVDSTSVQERVVGTCPAGSKVASITQTGGVTCDATVGANQVGTSQIVDVSVTTGKLASAAVTSSKLAANSVDSSKIVDGSIAEADLSPTHHKAMANGIASLDGTGKIPSSQMPDIAMSKVDVVGNYTERDALPSPTAGDVAIVTSTAENFIYDGVEWQLMLSNADVSSVFGRTGHITADTSDISEHASHLYYTEARVSANSDVAANTAHSALTSGNPHGVTLSDLGIPNVQNTKHRDDAVTNPTATEDAASGYSVGSYWINTATDGVYICADASNGAAIWQRLDLYTAKIGNTHLQSNAVTSVKIADGTITNADVDSTSIQERVSGTCAVGSSIISIGISGSVVCDDTISSNKIGSSHVIDGSIATVDLADSSITTAKLAANSVDSSKIVDGTITATDIDSTSVQERVVGTCAAGTHVTAISQAGGVTCTNTVDSNTVGSAQIVDASIATADLGNAQVTLAKLAANSVDSSKIVDNTIAESDMSAAYKRGVANGIPTLNSLGLVPDSQLPSLSISDIHVVADIPARDALTVQSGDMAKVTSTGITYVWDGSAWIEITASSDIQSVNGHTGVVVLDTDDVAEGTTNKYYTEARVTANTNVAANTAHAAVTSGNPHGVSKSDVGLSYVQNIKSKFDAVAAPANTDDSNSGYSVGSVWVDVSADRAYVCADASVSAAVWKSSTMEGDLSGPASATDHAIARFDGITGKLVQNSAVFIDDAGNIALSGTVDGRDVSVDGSALDAHLGSTSNPHSVTKTQIGLSNVPNLKQKLDAVVAPSTTDDSSAGYAVGSAWIDVSADKAYTCVDASVGAAVWVETTQQDTGETNTASSVGVAGVSVYKQKSGANLEFRSINAASSKVSITLDAGNNEIDVGVVEANIVHDSLSGAGTNTHAQIDTFIASKGQASGLASLDGAGKVPLSQIPLDGSVVYQGTWNAATNTPTITSSVGTQGHYYVVSVTGTTTIDGISQWTAGDHIIFNGAVWEKTDLTDAVSSVAGKQGAVTLEAADILSGTFANGRISQSSVTQHQGAINHDSLSGYVANKHVDHSLVSITAGVGLSGGGTIAASRTLDLDLNSLTADNTPDAAADYVVTYDASAGSHKKVLLSNLPGSGDFADGGEAGGAARTLGNTDAFALGFETSDLERIHIEADGDVGVGNTAPLGFFDVRKTTAGSANHIAFTVHDTPIVDNYNLGLDTGDSSWMEMTCQDGTYRQAVVFASDGGGTSTVFGVSGSADSGASWSPEFVVTQNARIGVGKSVPTQAVDVVGNIALTGTVDGRDVSADGSALDAHTASSSNPHGVTKAQIGLSEVPNLKQKLDAVVAPGATDDSAAGYAVGSTWIDTVTNKAYVCVDSTATAAVWTETTQTGSGGEANTASNSGVGGVSVFKQKVGVDLEFYSINAASSKISVALDAGNNEIDVNVVEANIVHDSLSGAGTNTHAQIDTFIASKGQASGLASLDGSGKVPLSQIPLDGSVTYEGTWDAATNTPTLTSSVGTKGHYYVVSVTGTTTIDGISQWTAGDHIIFNGAVWEKSDLTDAVSSVAGKQGAVTLEAADILSGTFADGRISASSVTQHTGNKVTKGGDSDAAPLVLGTNDAQELHLETNGVTRATVNSAGEVGIGASPTTNYALTVFNGPGKHGFRVRAGENAGDIAFSVEDQDGTFPMMQMEANNGYISMGKTVAQTQTDNGQCYGLDIQYASGVATDFNTQNGVYRIGGVALNANHLSDVDTATVAPSNDQVLKWNGVNWVPGDPSGLEWVGAWALSTAYSVHDAVAHNGASYICISAHTSAAGDEPLVGGSWATYWDVLSQKGAQGAGSNIGIKEEGSDIAGGPHTDINFVGALVTATDGGAGVATVTLAVPANSITSTELASDLAFGGFLEISDVSAPANAGAGKGRIYKKTGDDGLFWKPDAAGPEVDLTVATSAINDLTDVDTSTVAPASGDHLEWNGSNWVPSAVVATSLEFQTAEDATETSTTSTTFVQKLRMTTPTLPAGDYRIGYYYEWTGSSVSFSVGVQVQVDDTTTIHNMDNAPENVKTFNGDAQAQTESGFQVVTLTNAAHNIDIDYRAMSGGTSYLSNVRLEIWRVDVTALKGDKGDTGAGSNIVVKEEGTTVTGGPHDTLNFVGADVTVTDAGGGTATVTFAPAASSITNQVVSSVTTTSTTSSTYVLLSGMTVTPASGTYLVTFSASGELANAANDAQYAIYSAGAIVPHSERRAGWGGGGHANAFSTSMHTQAVVTVNGAQAIEVQYHSGASDFTVHERSIILLKLA